MKKLFPLILIVLITGLSQSSANPHAISDISYLPETVYKDTNVTISITFDDTSNISRVGSFYCKVSPEYICYVPAMIMVADGNTYSTSFTIKENGSEAAGFDIFIEYTNGSKLTIPKDEQIDVGLPIVEPLEDIFYYKIDVADSSSESTADMYFNVLAIFLLLPILKKYRKL